MAASMITVNTNRAANISGTGHHTEIRYIFAARFLLQNFSFLRIDCNNRLLRRTFFPAILNNSSSSGRGNSGIHSISYFAYGLQSSSYFIISLDQCMIILFRLSDTTTCSTVETVFHRPLTGWHFSRCGLQFRNLRASTTEH